jgi:NADH-quinone oxidoreductase subunit M
VGAVAQRYGSTNLDQLGGGLLAKAPHLGSLLVLAAVASLGLPGLAGFWGEMLAMMSAFQPAAGQNRVLFLVFMAVAGIGAVLTAAYFLLMLRKVAQGTVSDRVRAMRIADVNGRELVAWVPLVLLVFAAGLWPRLVLGVTDGAVRALLGG